MKTMSPQYRPFLSCYHPKYTELFEVENSSIGENTTKKGNNTSRGTRHQLLMVLGSLLHVGIKNIKFRLAEYEGSKTRQ